MSESAPHGRGLARKLMVAGVVLLAAAASALWALRGCEKTPPPRAGAFDWFQAKAEELGRDPGRIKAFVAADIRTLGHAGDMKGPLATLWNGAGTAEEKARLLAVLLGCCDPRVESGAAWRGSAQVAGAAKLSVVLEVDTGGTASRTPVVSEECGLFCGAGHSLEIADGGKARLTLRLYGAEPVIREIDARESDSARLIFTLGGAAPCEIVRELWNKDNRTGPTFGIPGDRHDFIVLPSRVGKLVTEREKARVEAAGRGEDPAAKAYLALLDYCFQSDRILAGLEKENGVVARFDLPRILILSRFNLPEFVGGPAQALDLRQNFTGFEGEKVAAYSSVQTRGFTEAGLEAQWLAKFTEGPCTSAHDVITALREDYPDEPARRLQAVLDALAAAGAEPPGARLVFTARDPAAPEGSLPPQISLTKLADGTWSVFSGDLNAAVMADLEKNPDMPRLMLNAGRLDGATDSHERLALHVEVGLMAAEVVSPVGPRFVLQTRLDRAPASLVTVGADFTFQWGSGEDRVDQRMVVLVCSGSLGLETRVQTGLRPVLGQRTIAAGALENAKLHNPWYARGADVQADATSFVVSRRVYAALKAGESCEFALAGKYATLEDAAEGKPRPVTWRGRIEPLGAAKVKTRINNREEEIAVLRCRAGDREIAILDDPDWPIGMADRLIEVHTGIRGRLVDTGGTPIGGAEIEIGDAKVKTAFDGSFRLAPRGTPGYAKVKAAITRGADPLGEVEIDLTAPGLSEIVVAVPRPLKDLVFISPGERGKLDGLEVSAQVKRHAGLALDRGRCVTIPNRMLHVGEEEQIAFYSFDPATGETIGVMEWGIHGSMGTVKTAWKDAAKKVAKEAWKERKDIAEGGLPPIHMLRGALVAWWGYAAHRVGGSGHTDAILRLIAEMDYWEENSNFFSLAEKSIGGKAGEKVRGKLAEMVGGNMDGGAAAVAFKCGYLGAVGFLAKYMADRGNDD